MTVEIQGVLLKALEKKSGVSQNGNPWSVQGFVLNVNDKHIAFDVSGDNNIAAFEKQIGATIKVRCEISSREWNGRYFTSLRYVQPQQQQQTQTVQQAPVQQQTAVQQPQQVVNAPVSNDDPLPF